MINTKTVKFITDLKELINKSELPPINVFLAISMVQSEVEKIVNETAQKEVEEVINKE